MGCDLASAALPSSFHAMPPSRSCKVDGDSCRQPGAGQCSCLQPGLEGAVLPGHEKVEAIVPRGIWCRQGMQQQEGVSPADTQSAEALGALCTCQLGSSNLQVGGYSGKINSQTSFCSGKLQVRMQKFVVGLRWRWVHGESSCCRKESQLCWQPFLLIFPQ